MSRLLFGTDTVSMDEPCFSVKEFLAPAPDSRGVRRYQAIRVIRHGDRLAELRRDLGPAEAFKASEFVIPGGVVESGGRIEILHTVGELVDIADYLRSGQYRPPEPPRGTNLIQEYRDRPDKRQRRRKRLSQFGPVARIER